MNSPDILTEAGVNSQNSKFFFSNTQNWITLLKKYSKLDSSLEYFFNQVRSKSFLIFLSKYFRKGLEFPCVSFESEF